MLRHWLHLFPTSTPAACDQASALARSSARLPARLVACLSAGRRAGASSPAPAPPPRPGVRVCLERDDLRQLLAGGEVVRPGVRIILLDIGWPTILAELDGAPASSRVLIDVGHAPPPFGLARPRPVRFLAALARRFLR